ncbi:unnamed protein product [Linum trigynum]|uniref:Uncharacterized protein n=1 Tax=Linum trigynum TaxID=586398 RepID=A0AAV2CZL7_9ROSI
MEAATEAPAVRTVEATVVAFVDTVLRQEEMILNEWGNKPLFLPFPLFIVVFLLSLQAKLKLVSTRTAYTSNTYCQFHDNRVGKIGFTPSASAAATSLHRLQHNPRRRAWPIASDDRVYHPNPLLRLQSKAKRNVARGKP